MGIRMGGWEEGGSEVGGGREVEQEGARVVGMEGEGYGWVGGRDGDTNGWGGERVGMGGRQGKKIRGKGGLKGGMERWGVNDQQAMIRYSQLGYKKYGYLFCY